MRASRTSSVRDIAASLPGALRVFDDLHIDYCSLGERSFAEACTLQGLDVAEVEARIEEAAEATPTVDGVWHARPLASLVEHIVSHYHGSTRAELVRLRGSVAELLEAEGASHPELATIATLLAELENEMIPHMVKEERIVFPYVIELEARARAGNLRPRADLPCGENPMRAMMEDHRHADATVHALRAACAGYVVPARATPAVAALYSSLEELERTLHHHVHLESNVLFRRAAEIERGA